MEQLRVVEKSTRDLSWYSKDLLQYCYADFRNSSGRVDMARLFSYCIPVDDGAAPNPFWGLCTLVICKPRIRRAAAVGDWVVGTGSRRSPIGDLSGQVVYAMRITKKLTMEEYDVFARDKCPGKIPSWFDRDVRRRLGDAIYDFSCDPPRIRRSVHGEQNRERDISGEYALISDHFYYFGDKPRSLPKRLRSIARQHQMVGKAAAIAEDFHWRVVPSSE